MEHILVQQLRVCLCAWQHVCVHTSMHTRPRTGCDVKCILARIESKYLNLTLVRSPLPQPRWEHTHTCTKRHLGCWFVGRLPCWPSTMNWSKRQTHLQLWNKKRSSVLIETFTLSKAATTCVCSHCKECVLFALFSYHDPWSMEEPPDAANNIPLGPDTTGRRGLVAPSEKRVRPLGSDRCKLQSWCCYLPSVWQQTREITPLSLSFLICKKEVMVVPTS